MKNIKNINATIINLKERDIKGLALSTIILLVIKAEDHNITKVRGIKLKMKIKYTEHEVESRCYKLIFCKELFKLSTLAISP